MMMAGKPSPQPNYHLVRLNLLHIDALASNSATTAASFQGRRESLVSCVHEGVHKIQNPPKSLVNQGPRTERVGFELAVRSEKLCL